VPTVLTDDISIRTLDILRTEGACPPHMVSLCNLIYPVINVIIIKIIIANVTEESKENEQFIQPLKEAGADFPAMVHPAT